MVLDLDLSAGFVGWVFNLFDFLNFLSYLYALSLFLNSKISFSFYVTSCFKLSMISLKFLFSWIKFLIYFSSRWTFFFKIIFSSSSRASFLFSYSVNFSEKLFSFFLSFFCTILLNWMLLSYFNCFSSSLLFCSFNYTF